MKMLFSVLNVLLLGCSSSTVKEVDIEEYSNLDKCWYDDDFNISLYLILVNSESFYTAYPVSYRCNVKTPGLDRNQSFMGGIRILKIADEEGLLKKNLSLSLPIVSASSNHTPQPKSNSEIYYIEGKLLRSSVNDGDEYRFDDIYITRKLKLGFSEFLVLSPEERRDLALSTKRDR